MQRRDFIKVGAAAAAAAPAVVRAAAAVQKVRMGFIGVGNRGTQVLHLFMRQPDVEVTALCDIYDPYLKRDESAFDPKFFEWGLKGRLPVFNGKDGKPLPLEQSVLDAVKARRCKLYTDYRRLLEDPNVDAVYIATPDHWHAIMTIDAIKAGKDVYCEKPLTATVAEGRAMVNAQKASKQVVCVGLNRRGSAVYRKLKAEIDSGKYGTFRVGRAARISNLFPNGIGKCPPCQPPKGLDWDKWLGPRAFRPYKYTTAPYYFRWHEEFSSQMGNWGVHYMDAMRWMMGEVAPCAITAVGGQYFLDHDADIPDTMEVTYEFPDKKIIHFMIYEGGTSKPIFQRELELQGSDGAIYANERGYDIYPQKGREFNNPKKPLFEEQHYNYKEAMLDDGSSGSSTSTVIRDFLDRIKDRGTPLCTLEDGHRSTCFAHLANIALHMGQRLEWDPATEKFTNCPKANELLSYTYRDGYKLG